MIAAKIHDDIAAGETEITILCSPTDEPVHAQSLTVFCASCMTQVWLSVRIAAELVNVKTEILCIPCGLARHAARN